MGYFFLGLSLLAGVIKGYCGKKTSGYVEHYSAAVTMNLIRMLLCVCIGGGMMLVEGNAQYFFPGKAVLALCAVAGLSTSVFVVCWLIAAKNGAYMMLDVFLMLGVLIPVGGGAVLYQEKIRAVQWMGILLLVLAALAMCSYNNEVKEKLSFSSVVLLTVCSASGGVTDLMQKLFVRECAGMPASVFSFYTYLFSALTLFLSGLALRSGNAGGILPQKAERASLKSIMGYIAVMSCCLFANTFFKTMAAGYLTSIQLYPLSQGGSLILSVCMVAVMFGEKPTKKCILGLLTAFTGLLALNVL